jgi:ribosome maturation factor RimP
LAKIEERVESLIGPRIESLGYRLYDVEFVKEGKDFYLRVYIDKDSGISLEDCEAVSNGINEVLDEADYIKEQYFLEVSSPGVERVLKKDRHLKENIGNKVQVKLFKPLAGKKVFEGLLESFSDDNICIKIESQILEIERSNIGQIKTVFDWN